jgi:hypothetical protein
MASDRYLPFSGTFEYVLARGEVTMLVEPKAATEKALDTNKFGLPDRREQWEDEPVGLQHEERLGV